MLKSGDAMPSFSLSDEEGNTIDNESIQNKRVLFWFYPKADTPGCTVEGCALRDDFRALQRAGLTVYGVSFDGPAANKAFKEKFDFPFALLCDEERTLGIAMHAAEDKEAAYAKRISYVVEGGEILLAYDKVDPKTHSEQILQDVKNASPKKDALAAGLDDARDALSSLTSLFKEQLSLSSKHAREAFEKVEPHLTKAGNDLRRATEEVKAQALTDSDEVELKTHLALMDAKEKWSAVRDQMVGLVREVKKETGDEVEQSVDEAKLKAHLAKMESEEALKEKSDALKKRLQEAKTLVQKEAQDTLSQLHKSFSDLLEGMGSNKK